jgi:hypothetical protein
MAARRRMGSEQPSGSHGPAPPSRAGHLHDAVSSMDFSGLQVVGAALPEDSPQLLGLGRQLRAHSMGASPAAQQQGGYGGVLTGAAYVAPLRGARWEVSRHCKPTSAFAYL